MEWVRSTPAQPSSISSQAFDIDKSREKPAGLSLEIRGTHQRKESGESGESEFRARMG